MGCTQLLEKEETLTFYYTVEGMKLELGFIMYSKGGFSSPQFKR